MKARKKVRKITLGTPWLLPCHYLPKSVLQNWLRVSTITDRAWVNITYSKMKPQSIEKIKKMCVHRWSTKIMRVKKSLSELQPQSKISSPLKDRHRGGAILKSATSTPTWTKKKKNRRSWSRPIHRHIHRHQVHTSLAVMYLLQATSSSGATSCRLSYSAWPARVLSGKTCSTRFRWVMAATKQKGSWRNLLIKIQTESSRCRLGIWHSNEQASCSITLTYLGSVWKTRVKQNLT